MLLYRQNCAATSDLPTSTQELLCWSVYHCVYHYSVSKLDIVLVQSFGRPVHSLQHKGWPFQRIFYSLLVSHKANIAQYYICIHKMQKDKIQQTASSMSCLLWEISSQWHEKNSIWYLFIWIISFQSWYSESSTSLTSHNEEWLLILAVFREDGFYLRSTHLVEQLWKQRPWRVLQPWNNYLPHQVCFP